MSNLIDHHLLDLLEHFLNPDLNFLFIGLLLLSLVIANLFSSRETPSIPFVYQTFAKCNQFSTDVAFFGCVFFVELPTVLLEISPDRLLFLFAQECGRARSPNELFKPVLDLFDELLATEIPYGITILKLVTLSLARNSRIVM